MIERVLNLNQRTVSSIMTSRHDIEHIDLSAPEAEIRALLEKNQHTRLVVTGGKMTKTCLAWCTLSTCCSNRCARTAQPARPAAPAAGVPETLPLLPPSSSSVMPGPTLPSWSMSSAPLRAGDAQRRDGNHRR
jgi:CBS domain containing-hemolysin-like protein